MKTHPARAVVRHCLAMLVLLARPARATIVGIFGGASTGTFPGRVSSLGYATEFWWLPHGKQ